jgi:hypothetical protein
VRWGCNDGIHASGWRIIDTAPLNWKEIIDFRSLLVERQEKDVALVQRQFAVKGAFGGNRDCGLPGATLANECVASIRIASMLTCFVSPTATANQLK